MFMRTHKLRSLPAVPIRPHLEVMPVDVNGWLNHGEVAAPRSNHSPTAPPLETDHDRVDRFWQEHIPHAGRRPPQKGVANFRGSTVDATRREIVLESTLELAASAVAQANRHVSRLQPQVGPVHHLDEDGKERSPVFDFVATFTTGRTIAIAIKPSRRRQSSGIDNTVAAVRRQRPDFADEATVWTEEQLSKCAEYNAGLILRSRRLRNELHVAAMRKVVVLTLGVFPLSHLLWKGCADPRGFTAAVNLIDDGVLVPVERGRIRPELRVRFAA